MPYIVPHVIDGNTVESEGRSLTIYNPATGAVTGSINVADRMTIDNAVSAAKLAWPAWSTTTASYRAAILFRFKELLDKNKQALATLVTQEQGKTIAEAIGSVQRGIDVVDFSCGIANLLKGEFSDDVASNVDVYSLRQSLGVCVGITPFNFPAMIPLWMFPLAIACGNTFILKPSEKDPSCANKLLELAAEAGVPNGVVNILQGDKEVVDTLIQHKGVQAVSFVGSSAAAEHVYKTAINHNKRAQAFGGAKNHCVVMPDADLEQAATVIVSSAFGSAGERCMALSVVVVVGDDIADALIDCMLPKIKQFKVGSGMQENVDMGPLVTAQHWDKVNSYVEIGKQEGADLLIDGSQYRTNSAESGFFMGACLFDHVKSNMRIYREEIFGPVLSIVRVQDFDSALQLINEHEYGNGTAIFTGDGYTARTFAQKVQVGMVGINVPVPVPVAYHSFGGWKQSIFADIGMYGMEAIRFYTKLKTVTQRWNPKR
jgi:malonate-semialdehyde dehydrogenase (acetylating) / methylmalonate-semialdehyde dehydrogenase